MGNMGYCRFQNTLGDLRDCEEALADGLPGGRDERRAALDLIGLCRRIADGCEFILEDAEPRPDEAGK